MNLKVITFDAPAPVHVTMPAHGTLVYDLPLCRHERIHIELTQHVDIF
jgi:hypothetical protein